MQAAYCHYSDNFPWDSSFFSSFITTKYHFREINVLYTLHALIGCIASGKPITLYAKKNSHYLLYYKKKSTLQSFCKLFISWTFCFVSFYHFVVYLLLHRFNFNYCIDSLLSFVIVSEVVEVEHCFLNFYTMAVDKYFRGQENSSAYRWDCDYCILLIYFGQSINYKKNQAFTIQITNTCVPCFFFLFFFFYNKPHDVMLISFWLVALQLVWYR